MRPFIILLCFGLVSSCFNIKTGDPIDGIAPGSWHGAFLLNEQPVPVMYEVLNTDSDKAIEVIFKTADQELKADKVRKFGDTLFVHFNKANTMLKLIYQIDQMDGFLYDHDSIEYPIAFAGQRAILHRFPDIRKTPVADLTGQWKIAATVDKDSTLEGTVRFVAKNNYIEARLALDHHKEMLLEGTIQGDKLYLSGFDGKTICMINATVKDKKHLVNGSLIWNNNAYFWEGEGSAGVLSSDS